MDELIRNPDARYHFAKNGWKFEEFLAGCYERAGYDRVELTRGSGDFNRDIVVEKFGHGGVKLLVQAKAFSSGRVVTNADVRAMGWTLETDRNASKAIITTTSRFAPRVTQPNGEFSAYFPNRLELVDGEMLIAWLKTLRAMNGQPSTGSVGDAV